MASEEQELLEALEEIGSDRQEPVTPLEMEVMQLRKDVVGIEGQMEGINHRIDRLAVILSRFIKQKGGNNGA